MKKELWDIYDECFEKTGRVIMRGEPLKKGDYHLVVHIYPVSADGQILVQKRSMEVEWMPGIWAATGGSAVAGETPWQACHRELLEELGIDADKDDAMLAAIFKRTDSFNCVFVIRTDKDVNVTLQKEEVAQAKWLPVEQIREMMKEGSFHKYAYFDWLAGFIGSSLFHIIGNSKEVPMI